MKKIAIVFAALMLVVSSLVAFQGTAQAKPTGNSVTLIGPAPIHVGQLVYASYTVKPGTKYVNVRTLCLTADRTKVVWSAYGREVSPGVMGYMEVADVNGPIVPPPGTVCVIEIFDRVLLASTPEFGLVP